MASSSAALLPPTAEERTRLQQELSLWVAHKGYQIQQKERTQLWRVQNTSITLSTGSGIGTYYLLRYLRPSLKFPLDIIPPFLMFYATQRVAQALQLPGLYNSFLALSTPLGAQTREILQALRTGGRLPSHEFGTQLPTPARPSRPAPGGATPAVPSAPAAAVSAGVERPAAPPQAGSGPEEAPAPPVPAAWGDEAGEGALDAGPAAWGEAWGEGGQAQGQPPLRPTKPRTWDEIRAMSAQRESERR